MANYLLWGKDPITGLNAKQAGIVDIETKHGTWDKDSNVESLEGLMESPTFSEASLAPLGSVPMKIKRETFSRKEALANCPEYLVPTFTALFRQIDELDVGQSFNLLNSDFIFFHCRVLPYIAHLTTHRTSICQNDAHIGWRRDVCFRSGAHLIG